MSVFLLLAGAMLALGLSLVLLPLLRHDLEMGRAQADLQAQSAALNLDVLRDHLRELDADSGAGDIDAAGYRAARQELEQRVAEDIPLPPAPPASDARQRWPVLVVALALPSLAIFLYAMLGNPAGVLPAPVAALPSPDATVDAGQIEAMVARLAARLKAQPNDAAGWRMLARSEETLRRFEPAADAYRHLLALSPDDPDVLVDYAVVLGMTSNRSLAGEPERLLARALAIDPKHIQALALSGSAALERGDYANAIKPWQRILAQLPADSDMARSIADDIAKAQARAAGAPQ